MEGYRILGSVVSLIHMESSSLALRGYRTKNLRHKARHFVGLPRSSKSKRGLSPNKKYGSGLRV